MAVKLMTAGKSSYRKQNRKRIVFIKRLLVLMGILVLMAVVIWGVILQKERAKVKRISKIEIPNWIDSQIIDIDGVSRNGKSLVAIKDIVIHYVGNPGSTAQQNRDFYSSFQSSVSSHFIVGLEGEVIQCIPLDERSAASNWRNNDTISIEVCHPDDTGKFNKKTYRALIKLTAWLENVCRLKEKNIIRHYDITGKECPRYYVRNEDKWQEFKDDVKKYRENGE